MGPDGTAGCQVQSPAGILPNLYSWARSLSCRLWRERLWWGGGHDSARFPSAGCDVRLRASTAHIISNWQGELPERDLQLQVPFMLSKCIEHGAEVEESRLHKSRQKESHGFHISPIQTPPHASVCMAESFLCPPETIPILLISYTPIQNKSLNKLSSTEKWDLVTALWWLQREEDWVLWARQRKPVFKCRFPPFWSPHLMLGPQNKTERARYWGFTAFPWPRELFSLS